MHKLFITIWKILLQILGIFFCESLAMCSITNFESSELN